MEKWSGLTSVRIHFDGTSLPAVVITDTEWWSVLDAVGTQLDASKTATDRRYWGALYGKLKP